MYVDYFIKVGWDIMFVSWDFYLLCKSLLGLWLFILVMFSFVDMFLDVEVILYLVYCILVFLL